MFESYLYLQGKAISILIHIAIIFGLGLWLHQTISDVSPNTKPTNIKSTEPFYCDGDKHDISVVRLINNVETIGCAPISVTG